MHATLTPAAPRPCRSSRRAFTLLELLIAMALLSVMMMLLLHMVFQTQRLWRLNTATNLMFERSRLVFDILEHDLRASYASTIIGKTTGFYVGAPNNASALQGRYLTFVSSSDPHPDSLCNLCEISYWFHTDQGTANPSVPPFTLARQVTCDNDAANWDFFNRPANWFINNNVSADLASYEVLSEGILNVTMSCYDRTNTLIPPNTENPELPSRVEVNIMLFDENLLGLPASERFKTQRSFTKVIFLGDMRTD